MKGILDIAVGTQKTAQKQKVTESIAVECNYGNNYYGDQMCVAKQNKSHR